MCSKCILQVRSMFSLRDNLISYSFTCENRLFCRLKMLYLSRKDVPMSPSKVSISLESASRISRFSYMGSFRGIKSLMMFPDTLSCQVCGGTAGKLERFRYEQSSFNAMATFPWVLWWLKLYPRPGCLLREYRLHSWQMVLSTFSQVSTKS